MPTYPFNYYQPLDTNRTAPTVQPMYSYSTGPQTIQGLIKVTGIEGAKAYQMPPNSVIPLFDANNDVMYIKSTDGAGFPTIKQFTFSPIEEQPQVNEVDYIPRSEFNILVEQVNVCECGNCCDTVTIENTGTTPIILTNLSFSVRRTCQEVSNGRDY